MDAAALVAKLRQLPGLVSLTADSRLVQPGDVFMALPGAVHDGREYIGKAVAEGAVAVLWEPDGYQWPSDLAVANIPVAGLKAKAPAIAAAWWNEPSRSLWMTGITGTNGKTSCSHWLAEAFGRLNRKTAIVGTLGNGFPDCLQDTRHTTPDAVTLQGLLAGYRNAGATGVVMEVSSHALDQGRVDGVGFDVAALTNLSRDHLDYHGDMAAYARAKARLFEWPGLRWAVLNLEDDLGRNIYHDLAGSDVHRLSYGLGCGEISGAILNLGADGFAMQVETPWGRGELHTRLVGRFNANNLLACLGVLLASNVSLADALAELEQSRPAPGRMQRLGGNGRPVVIVDYAHTPDALEQVLTALRSLTRKHLICVFGCGGGRDRGKRPLMGEVAARLADRIIVTSDNPRNEEPEAIVADILAGMPAGQTVELDRAVAIRTAVAEAGPDDVVLLAGKGHEDYQDIRGKKRPFSDAKVAEKALKERDHAPA